MLRDTYKIIMSVCLSVCLSATFQYRNCYKMYNIKI